MIERAFVYETVRLASRWVCWLNGWLVVFTDVFGVVVVGVVVVVLLPVCMHWRYLTRLE